MKRIAPPVNATGVSQATDRRQSPFDGISRNVRVAQVRRAHTDLGALQARRARRERISRKAIRDAKVLLDERLATLGYESYDAFVRGEDDVVAPPVDMHREAPGAAAASAEPGPRQSLDSHVVASAASVQSNWVPSISPSIVSGVGAAEGKRDIYRLLRDALRELAEADATQQTTSAGARGACTATLRAQTTSTPKAGGDSETARRVRSSRSRRYRERRRRLTAVAAGIVAAYILIVSAMGYAYSGRVPRPTLEKSAPSAGSPTVQALPRWIAGPQPLSHP